MIFCAYCELNLLSDPEFTHQYGVWLCGQHSANTNMVRYCYTLREQRTFQDWSQYYFKQPHCDTDRMCITHEERSTLMITADEFIHILCKSRYDVEESKIRYTHRSEYHYMDALRASASRYYRFTFTRTKPIFRHAAPKPSQVILEGACGVCKRSVERDAEAVYKYGGRLCGEHNGKSLSRDQFLRMCFRTRSRHTFVEWRRALFGDREDAVRLDTDEHVALLSVKERKQVLISIDYAIYAARDRFTSIDVARECAVPNMRLPFEIGLALTRTYPCEEAVCDVVSVSDGQHVTSGGRADDS